MGGSYDPGINRSDISQAVGASSEATQRQREFLDALTQRQDAIGNQNLIFGRALDTMNTLQDQSQGGGPNPALAQLALTTGQNVRNQAALIAGQRGVGNNPGLAVRQIGQLGGDVQNQANAQAATLRANQQLAAQQQLQQQQALLGQMAGTQFAQRQSAIAGLGGLAQGQAGQYLGALGQAEKTRIENDPFNKIMGGLIGAAGTVGAAALGASQGGRIPGKALVKGDHPKNDTVPAMLSPGEVVIPRSAVRDPKKVAAFINKSLGMNLKPGKKS